MTLDEQIAWLADEACALLASAKDAEEYAAKHFLDALLADGSALREEAAAMLTIENTLRALRDQQRPRIRNGDPIVVLVRPARRPRKNEQPQEVRATYIKRDREQGGVLVDIGGETRRVRHANIRRAM